MDAAGLRTRIQATLDANADARRQAELDLRNAEDTPGFCEALLNILEAEQDTAVRLSTVVYLKNRITKGWAPIENDQSRFKAVPEGDKQVIRARLVPILAASPPQIRAQLQWPDFLNITVNLLNQQDAGSVFAGLQCLLAICRVYRFKMGETREDFDKILLNIANSLVNETSLEAGEMLRTILKAYKHAIYFELPRHLREQQQIVGWCTLFLNVVAKDPPAESMIEDLDEREQNHWFKCKKWSYVNLNRLYVRYGNPTNLAKNEAEYADKPCLSFTLVFMEECIKPKTMWDHLKPHMQILIQHLIFPVLCQSDEDIELFETDPSEYLHRKLNFYEEARRKQTFSVLNYVNDVVNRYEAAPEDQKNPREKEGALRMIGTLSGVILGKKSPIADQVEFFFVRHVFPEFRSPHGYLRARACDTLEKFEALDFKDSNNLLVIYRNILESMADPELPVRVEASLALQPLIRHDVIRISMQGDIPQIMQQLLKLANEVDVDALANVMEDFVEVFAAELTPFAVALSEQLRDTYLRIVRELIERNSSKEGDDEYGDFLDDKSITALGVLQTIGTLILTLESTPDVLAHLETILMPVITITLEHKLYDLYNEVFEIIDSCTFAAKTISSTMWNAFELIHRTFKSGAELYLEDMLPALENFVNYGSEALIHQPQYLEAIVDMIRTIFQNDSVGGVERICGCKLAEMLMLTLRGHIDNYIPEFIMIAMTVLNNDDVKVKSYRIHLMETVINALYYNPSLALHILEQNGQTNKFFSLWFSSIDIFTRVHDKKLSIAAITSLIVLPADQVPVSVQPGWPRLLQGIVRLFQTLPAAIKNREEATREDDFGIGGDYDDEEEDDEWEGEVDWTAEEIEGETDDIKDESAAYLDFLSQQASKFSSIGDDDDDDELEEESLLETPLDKVEPYGMFKHALFLLQQQQPQLYQDLTKTLSPEEQQIIQTAVNQADQIAAQQAALAQQVTEGAAPLNGGI
ncbi:unnamed protein product [Aureobasidium pullulans]|nr:unnamed protein product [Aureobasidium pullulans]